MHAAALFYRPTCGYCLKVLRFIQQNNISIPLKDVSRDPGIRDELITIAGKTQVPCLVVNGKPLLESDHIVKWLKENWSKSDNT
jgi:glutaredoxin